MLANAAIKHEESLLLDESKILNFPPTSVSQTFVFGDTPDKNHQKKGIFSLKISSDFV